jgi:carboxyl-terminal processing protease
MSIGFQNTFFSSGKLLEEVFHFADVNRTEIKTKYQNTSVFVNSFTVPESLVNSIFSSSGINIANVNPQDKKIGTMFIKAFLARELYGLNAYFKTITPHDNMVKVALGYFYEK